MKRILASLLALWFAYVPAHAGSMLLLGAGSIGTGVTPFSISYVSNNNSVVAGTSFSFASQSIGTADATRIVVVAVTLQNTGLTITGLTIGGVAASEVTGSLSNSDTGGASSDIWALAVPSGTTATIAVTTSASAARLGIQVYSVVGTGASVSTGASTFTSIAVTTLSTAATIPAGGGAIAVGNIHNSTSSGFTGTNLTVDNGLVYGNSAAESGHNTTSSGSTTMGFTWTTAADGALSIATFNP